MKIERNLNESTVINYNKTNLFMETMGINRELTEESDITDSMKKERIKILDEIENKIKKSGGTINISSNSKKCFLGERKTGGSPVSGPHSICLAGFGKDGYNKAFDIIKDILKDYSNYSISKDNYFTMFLSYKGQNINESSKFTDLKEIIEKEYPGKYKRFEFKGNNIVCVAEHNNHRYYHKRLFYINDEGEIVGWLTMWKDENLIADLEIKKKYRRQGYATKLIQCAVNEYDMRHLRVFKDNTKAVSLYKKLGYEEEKKNPNLKYDDRMYYMEIKSNIKNIAESGNEYTEDDEYLLSYFIESEESTYIIRDSIYPIVEKVLSTSQGDRKFRRTVEEFINKNSSKLHTSGPVYMVPFTDRDKDDFFNVFNTSKEELLRPINQMTKTVNDKANWRLLKQNPIFCLFYEAIRYYTLKRDNTGVNTSLAIYALSVYPSVFSVIFPHGANPDIMQYTIDNLTAKYIMKQAGNVFSALMLSIQNSYRFLRDGFADSPDVEVIRFIARIRNDQKSMMKNVANNYYANHKQGLRVKTQAETYGNDQLIDDNTNNTSVVEDVTRKIVISLITNGVDMTRASAAAKIAGVSISDLRFYLSKVVVEDRTDELQKFIEAILFIFLYQEHHKPSEINERKFLQFAMELFRRTNANDVNVVTIKDSLQKWSDDIGVTERFKRLASQINYKKGIYMYMILCIQYYNS